MKNYAKSMLYIIGNDEYLDKNGILSINDSSYSSYNSSISNEIKIKKI